MRVWSREGMTMTFGRRSNRRIAAAVITLGAGLLALGGASASGAGPSAVESAVGVSAFGDATSFGSPSQVNQPIVGIAPTADGKGYWLVASDGGVFTFGDAGFFGSAGNIALNRPVVGMAPTPDGKGYWLVASDGGVFTYGDAGFFGSAGNIALHRPIVGLAATPDGKGYWLVASDGGVFTYGDAGFFGSTGNVVLNAPIVGLAATPTGKGYWLVASDGGVFTFGDAGFFGSNGAGTAAQPTVGLAATPDGKGYWTTTSIKVLPKPCQTSQLSVAMDPTHSGGGAAGSLGITYIFTNTSATACTLAGFPALQLLNASGQHLTTTTIPNGDTPTTVTLPSAGHAWFDILFPTQTGFGNLHCPTSSSLAVTPPSNTSALRITGAGGQIAPYGGDIPHLMCGNINTSPVLDQPPF
jgi:Protein of unknown function (DUF4232)